MNAMTEVKAPLRILIYALGGEGGGVLMNWIVAAARAAGRPVQATSVPGVAQRTGSTTYYIEVADPGTRPIFNLVPMPGRVDLLIASELAEAGRALEAGYVSPGLTTLIASTGRTFTTAEKIQLGDGRYPSDRVIGAAEALSRDADLRDFTAMAEAEGTYISAVLFGAAARALPWPVEASRAVVEGRASLAGFDKAAGLGDTDRVSEDVDKGADAVGSLTSGEAEGVARLPDHLRGIAALGHARCADYQDRSYADLYLERLERLSMAAGDDQASRHAVSEAGRRLALWMCYEDISRVADLKTRPERFDRIRAEVQLTPGQHLSVIEYLKPRLEEIADVLPTGMGRRLRARAEAGRGLPFLGKGRYVRSTGPLGFRLLRAVAWIGRFRKGSLRYAEEQDEIADWIDTMVLALKHDSAFAEALAELPRVRKGYSDTALRGLRAYRLIRAQIVEPARMAGFGADNADRLRGAISAAMADDTHAALDAYLAHTGGGVTG